MKMTLWPMIDRNGDVSIGYMFVLIISALVMTAMSLISADFINTSSDVAKTVQVDQVSIVMAIEIEEAIYMGSAHPGSVYHKNVTLPKEIYGIQYQLGLDNDFIYINGTYGEFREKISVSPPPSLTMSGSVPSTAGVILISYDGNSRIEIS